MAGIAHLTPLSLAFRHVGGGGVWSRDGEYVEMQSWVMHF